MNPQQYPPQPGQPGQTPPGSSGYGGPGGQPAQNTQPPYGQPQPGQWQQQPPAVQGQYSQDQPQAQQQNGYSNPYAYLNEYSLPPTKPKGPNKKVIVLVGFVVILLVASVVLVVLSGSGNTGNNGQNAQDQTGTQADPSATADVADRSDNTLDLSSKINSKETLKAQTLKGKTKQQVNLSSGFSFMVTKTEDYTSTDAAVQPAAGKKYVVITAVVGNRNETPNISVSYTDFRLRDANNQLLAPSAVTNQILNNTLASPSEVKPGAQITGKVVYEVDANDTSWVFKHSETYQKTTDDTTFTVEGEIVAQLASATSTGATAQ